MCYIQWQYSLHMFIFIIFLFDHSVYSINNFLSFFFSLFSVSPNGKISAHLFAKLHRYLDADPVTDSLHTVLEQWAICDGVSLRIFLQYSLTVFGWHGSMEMQTSSPQNRVFCAYMCIVVLDIVLVGWNMPKFVLLFPVFFYWKKVCRRCARRVLSYMWGWHVKFLFFRFVVLKLSVKSVVFSVVRHNECIY